MVITLYQQDIVWGNADANRQKAEHALANIPEATDIFVLPETFTTGFGEQMASQAEPSDGPTLRWAQRMAQTYSTLIVGTWIVREGEACYNRMHWIFPDGRNGHYDKAHLFRGSEADQIARGTEHPIFQYKGWRIRPAVCYDLRFPTWLRNKHLDYDLLLFCANWPTARTEAWTTLLKARAIENMCYVAGCNRTGADNAGTAHRGDSLLIDFKGKVLAQPDITSDASSLETTISATLDKERLDAFRERWPFHLDFD